MTARRVVQVVGPSTGGIRRHVRYLSEFLRSHDWAVDLVAPRSVFPDADHVLPPLRPRRPGGVVEARRVLRRALEGADIVHAHGLTVGWLASTVRPRPPLVVSVHNLVLDDVAGAGAPLLRWLEGRLPGRADATIAISDGVATRFAGHGGADRIRVIPPAGPSPSPSRDAGAVRAELGVGPDDDLVVTAARLTAQKGLDVLLDAAALVRRDRPGLRWFVFGDGVLRAELERAIDVRGLRGVVELAGRRPDVDSELAAADLVVVTSSWESGPLVVLEALALGRPVVSTDVGLAADVLGRGSGRVVPVGDAAALAAAVAGALAGGGPAAPENDARWRPAALAAQVEALYLELVR